MNVFESLSGRDHRDRDAYQSGGGGGGGRRGHGRRLPPTPSKPSTLQLKPPPAINFPKLNASPTHVSVRASACERNRHARLKLWLRFQQRMSAHVAPHSLHSLQLRERDRDGDRERDRLLERDFRDREP